MLYSEGVGAPISPDRKSGSSVGHAAAVLAGALLFAWPAVFNGYPLLYPDSITYIGSGRPVARALFLHKFSVYYGMRSLIYGLGIFPFHWEISPWPVVGLQALLAAYMLWLVVRSILERQTVVRYLLLAGLLSLLSSVSWYVSVVLPDVLGPLLWLAIYLLIFARDTLSSYERGTVALVACWAAASHISHLVLAAGICLLLVILRLLQCPQVNNRMRGIAEAAAIVLVAAVVQLALHAYLYGKASLEGESPPYLAARVIADGPGRWYLKNHCGEIRLALCASVGELPDNTDEFLWDPNGIWPTAAREGDDRIRQEETSFVVAVVRAYPREELSFAAANFWQQLGAFGLWDLGRNNWVLDAFDTALRKGKTGYLASAQFNDDLPLDLFSEIQFWTVVVSLGIVGIAAISPLMRRDASARLPGLGVVLLPGLVANALLTSVFSNAEERYQCRVIWVLPLYAGILILYWLDRHGEERRKKGSAH
ncbi:MAG TPA: hypothetical protein VEG63_09530 [Candidatus Acidoferrales bacterium]|nr:hypothetical protein [Candidatus Acidoferrales bacterium]